MMEELFDEEYLWKQYLKSISKRSYELGRADGIAESKAEGRIEERNLIIEKLKAKGMTDEEIKRWLE